MSKKQWYAKSTYLLVALALALSFGLVAVPMAGTVEAVVPADYYVDAATGSDAYTPAQARDPATPWKTITHAVGAVLPDDIIHVADGVYDPANGEVFPIDFNTNDVTLIGAGGDTSVVDANGQETNIFNILTDGVTISDFELRNAKGRWWSSTGNGIYMSDADNCDISNLEIYSIAGVASGSGSWEAAGIFMENGSDDNTFSSIEIHDISSPTVARGIWCDSCSGNQFSGINIFGVSVAGNAAFGIHLSGSSGNTLEEVTIDFISGGEWAEGIELQQSNGNTLGDLSIWDVTAGDYAYGIKLGDSCDNMFDSGSEIWNIGAECGCGIGIGIEKDPSTGSNGNTFESFDIHGTCYGFYIDKSSDNLITKSNIHDNDEGVHLCSAPSECVGDALHCNNIYGNIDYGVYKENAPDVDATGNWWGDAHGPSQSPGNGDEISDNVAFDPYLSFQFEYCEQCGGAIPPPASAVPTVSDWGIVAMIALFAGLLVWSVRRRRLAL
jgi:hypothetical protein